MTHSGEFHKYLIQWTLALAQLGKILDHKSVFLSLSISLNMYFGCYKEPSH